MENNLQHEDLLIKLRAKLNDEKIKLWEPPYLLPDNSLSQDLKDLSVKYAAELSADQDTVLNALHELQLHSLERSKANAEFQETGCATFRVRASLPGEKPQVLVIRRRLDVMGSSLIAAVAEEVKIVESRIKLIFNGKVIKPTTSLEEQGVKNGAQMMALIMAETPEQSKEEDTMYMEMRQTREDATLLAESAEELADDEEYMMLEDQQGNRINLPHAEKRSLVVGLALHERARAHMTRAEYALALVLLLEADRLFSECRSSILKSVDNYGVLQVDISWCYLCLQALQAASDAARRLAAADAALAASYGPHGERVKAVKGNDANERVLFMRLYLLQGIVAYHQNRREEARQLLDKAELEINALRVDDNAVTALMELGWSAPAARVGLRATGGDVSRAHHYLTERTEAKALTRQLDRENRQRYRLAVCVDGTPVKQQLVDALVGMGYSRRVAALALRNSNNNVADAVRIIQEQPDLLGEDSSLSSDEASSPSDHSLLEPDDKLVTELTAMGYSPDDARLALVRNKNHISGAVDLLVSCGGHVADAPEPANPSTSTAAAKKKHKKHQRDKKRSERMAALQRLHNVLGAEEDDYLDTSLLQEEQFLAQYKSLL